MVKKILTVMIFIFLFMYCYAPMPDEIVKARQMESWIKEVKRIEREKEFTRFKNDLAQRESSNDWMSINKIGCIGRYQFHTNTLHKLGYKEITVNRFRKNPAIFPPQMQEEAFISLVALNNDAIKEYEGYIGQTVKGVLITKSGLIAAAHLGGMISVRLFLKSKNKNPKDLFGTSVRDYIKDFAGYGI